MPTDASKRILAVLSDLFFMVKINEAAKQAGMAVEFVKSETDALLKAREQPSIIIVDLNFQGVNAVKLAAELKADAETSGISLLGFVSHVQGELKRQAQDAGCDMVLARSAFSQNLPAILKRHSG